LGTDSKSMLVLSMYKDNKRLKAELSKYSNPFPSDDGTSDDYTALSLSSPSSEIRNFPVSDSFNFSHSNGQNDPLPFPGIDYPYNIPAFPPFSQMQENYVDHEDNDNFKRRKILVIFLFALPLLLGLEASVFRTFNASSSFGRQLTGIPWLTTANAIQIIIWMICLVVVLLSFSSRMWVHGFGKHFLDLVPRMKILFLPSSSPPQGRVSFT